MKAWIWVMLSCAACEHAVALGLRRRKEALEHHFRNQIPNETEQDLRFRDITGAYGEVGVSIWLGDPWADTSLTFHEPDVAPYQVRSVHEARLKLIYRETDDPDEPFVSALVWPPFVILRGWLWGTECQQDQWLRGPNQRSPAWFVPAAALHPMQTAPRQPTERTGGRA